MTPLAHAIVKDSLLPPRKRQFKDHCALIGRMTDIHCFEVSKIVGLSIDVALKMVRDFKAGDFMDEDLAFLPADNTWIEWAEGGNRIGVLMTNSGAGADCRWSMSGNRFGSLPSVGRISFDVSGLDDETGLDVAFRGGDGFEPAAFTFRLYALLALINTPRIIGRQQHMPHAGLERRLRARSGVIGSFPLRAWTEIALSVSRPPEDLSDDDSREAHLTGQRALHFCRAHLRVRLGRVEFVRPHWRGDASLGIKRSRYEVRP